MYKNYIMWYTYIDQLKVIYDDDLTKLEKPQCS